jgi:hypothetical protein
VAEEVTAVFSEELLATGIVGLLPEESVGVGSVALDSVGVVEVPADEAGVVGVVVAFTVARVTRGSALASTFSTITEPSIATNRTSKSSVDKGDGAHYVAVNVGDNACRINEKITAGIQKPTRFICRKRVGIVFCGLVSLGVQVIDCIRGFFGAVDKC